MPSLSSKLPAEQKLKLILDSLEEKKAIAPEVMDLTGRTLVADYFVVTHGTSDVHIRALSDAVVEAMEEKGGQRARQEGDYHANWVLLDYGDVVVHIFTAEARAMYDLDSLWRTMEERRGDASQD
ncbi:MAG: ribosome silencing factor [Armatimonadota bacterium]|jgi:ribosome-associated protein|nr:MAG: ribosomal silencing factor RsfS [Armatimonadota bacterium]